MDRYKDECDESIHVMINHTAILPNSFDLLMPTRISKRKASKTGMKVGSLETLVWGKKILKQK